MKQKKYKLSEIEEMVNKINEGNEIDTHQLPAYGKGNDKRLGYVTVDKEGYSLFEFDPYHSKEKQHLTIKTIDINELLFEIFKASTLDKAFDYELKNRIPDQDTRIIAFKKHIEILSSLKLESKFINKLKEHYDNLLQIKKPLPIPDNW
jgi:hypothetical protein